MKRLRKRVCKEIGGRKTKNQPTKPRSEEKWESKSGVQINPEQHQENKTSA